MVSRSLRQPEFWDCRTEGSRLNWRALEQRSRGTCRRRLDQDRVGPSAWTDSLPARNAFPLTNYFLTNWGGGRRVVVRQAVLRIPIRDGQGRRGRSSQNGIDVVQRQHSYSGSCLFSSRSVKAPSARVALSTFDALRTISRNAVVHPLIQRTLPGPSPGASRCDSIRGIEIPSCLLRRAGKPGYG